jgi:DNA-directed RNA polymerase subunit RPC12/RpoP
MSDDFDNGDLDDRELDSGDEPDPFIICVDCGGRANLIEDRPEMTSYVCEDCWERFDLVSEDPEEDAGSDRLPPGAGATA